MDKLKSITIRTCKDGSGDASVVFNQDGGTIWHLPKHEGRALLNAVAECCLRVWLSVDKEGKENKEKPISF
jgi:hypothetical protein